MVSSFWLGVLVRIVSWIDYAQQTEGYSGSDLRLVCKEAAMRPVRRLVSQLEAMAESRGGEAVLDSGGSKVDGREPRDARRRVVGDEGHGRRPSFADA